MQSLRPPSGCLNQTGAWQAGLEQALRGYGGAQVEEGLVYIVFTIPFSLKQVLLETLRVRLPRSKPQY